MHVIGEGPRASLWVLRNFLSPISSLLVKDTYSWKKRFHQTRQHIKNWTHHCCQPLPTKVHLVKALFFPVLMDGSESWTIKKPERWRIDAFELCCWRRFLRVPWTARRSNQSILKEISPGCSLEGLMLKLKLQYFGHLMQRTDSFEKTLILGKIESWRRRGRQRMRWLDGITDSVDMSSSKCQELMIARKPGVLQSMKPQTVRHNWATELNWVAI